MRIELNIREPRILIKLLGPIPVIRKKRAVEPVIENGFRLQRKIDPLESKSEQPPRLLQSRIALRSANLLLWCPVKINEWTAAFENFASLKRQLQFDPPVSPRFRRHVERAHMLPAVRFRFRRDFQQWSKPVGLCRAMQFLNVPFLLDRRKPRVPFNLEKDLAH